MLTHGEIKSFAFGEIETYGFGEMKSVPNPTQSDFTAKRFHPSKMDLSRPQGRISLKKKRTRIRVSFSFSGCSCQARTDDIMINSHALYRLS